MAARDGGQVDVRFSVANAEVVRNALAMLGKDGEKALKQFDAAAKPVPKTTGLISNALSEAQGRAQEFASRLGPVGTGLVALGPAGLVAAGAIGAIVAAMVVAGQQVNLLAERAGRLRDFGETVNLTVRQVQALTIVGADVGVSGEKVEAGIGRMVVALEELRRGSGKAFDQLREISPELVDQLQRTRDTAESIDLLARAWQRMDTAQRAATSRALFGRDLGMVRVFGELAAAGGLANLERNLGTAITLTDEQAKKLDDLRDSAERLRNSAWERFWGIGAERVLQNQKEQAEQLDFITRKLEQLSRINISEKLLAALRLLLAPFSPRTAADAVARLVGGTPSGTKAGQGPDIAEVRGTPGSGRPSLEAQLAGMRERNALLGGALTPTEQLIQKELELDIAVGKNQITQSERSRALAEFIRTQQQAGVSMRQQLGILTEEELLRSRLRDLDDAQAKGYVRNAEERARAEQLIRREIKDTIDALEVRASRFQGLTRFTQDASNLDKQIDTVAVGGLNNMTSALTDIAMGTQNASQAFRNLALQVTRSVIEMVIRMQIALPIARALQQALGGFLPGGGIDVSQGSPGAGGAPFASALGNAFGPSGVIRFAHGGVIHRPMLFPFAHGIGMMGEAGPEAILPLRRGRGNRLGVEVMGGGAPVINFNVEDRAGVDMRSSAARRNADGSFDVDLLFERKVNKTIGSGGADRALRRQGARPVVTRR